MKRVLIMTALLTGGLLVVPLSAAPLRAAPRQEASETPMAVRELMSRDARIRVRAAEDLARRATAEQRKVVEGFRLQERDARVRLALDWALYRMGKNEALFAVVNELDTPRAGQSASYLTQIEGPRPLHLFLDRVNERTKLKLIEVLGTVGDAETAERLRPLAASPDQKLAAAARLALQDISERLAQTDAEELTRPRKLGQKPEGAETP